MNLYCSGFPVNVLKVSKISLRVRPSGYILFLSYPLDRYPLLALGNRIFRMQGKRIGYPLRIEVAKQNTTTRHGMNGDPQLGKAGFTAAPHFVEVDRDQ